MEQRILLDHGSGGVASHRLIRGLFLEKFFNEYLQPLDDGALLDVSSPISFSTDTYTIDPIFFPGGDIGSLAIHGTVNDVAMMGARPRFVSCGFVIEEGLEVSCLERIVSSMARAAQDAGVRVVTGDTKVVPRGSVDKIFINTTGIGEVVLDPPPRGNRAMPGDVIIVSGSIGDHGLAIMTSREGILLDLGIVSDSAPLNHMVLSLIEEVPHIHVLRDPTRGGLATTLNEIATQSQVEIEIEEEMIPVKDSVKQGCSLLGLDPLYLANEGKFLCILPEKFAHKALGVLRSHPRGRDATVIGRVLKKGPGQILLKTEIGGRRLLTMLEGEHLPRIC